VGGEDQLKALIRQTFSLQNRADKAVLDVDDVLHQSMANVKRLIETLPKEGLLRDKAWKDLQPLVQEELNKYGDRLGRSLVKADSEAAPMMRDYAVRELEHGGAELPEAVQVRNQPVPESVRMALNSKVNGVRVEQLFAMNPKVKSTARRVQQSKINQALFKTIDTRVRGGIIRGETTDQIAALMAKDVEQAGIPGVQIGDAGKQIRSQATAVARTATQDMARQVKEQVYEDNKEATEGMVWMWSTALDSKTCPTCAPLDQQRWEQEDSSRPSWPLHPNCRCQTVLIDPEDDFWNETSVNAQQVKPAQEWKKKDGEFQWVKTKPYTGKGAYKTPVVIDGKKYWRKAVAVTSDKPPTRLSDVYARWATSSNSSLEAAMGPTRARWFKAQYQKMNADPEKILQAMLTQKPAGQQTFIDVEKLKKKSLSFKTKSKPKPKVMAKTKTKVAAPKPTPTPAPTPTPTPTPAPKGKAPKKAKYRTADTNYDYDKNWEKLGYETKAKYRKAKSDVVEWSGEDFEGVRAAQFHKIQKAGGELNTYEKLQVKRLESGEARSFGKMAERLEDFVERAPKFDGELRRGVALSKPEEVKDLIERYSKGEKNKALESWTSEKFVSDRFAAGNRFPKAHRVSIVVENNTKGAPINGISGFDDEFEILVPSGVRYEVVEVKETFVKGVKGANPADAMDHTDYVLRLREVAD
jgi:SPP1 gp7 family putative phage head morphogenesis protein